MSGGHFNSNEYIYYRVSQFADELENDIQKNDSEDEYGYAPRYKQQTIDYLKPKIEEIRKMAEIMRAIDYLYSGDHGEDSFLEAVSNIEEGVK